MLGKTNNAILQQVEQAIQAKVQPKDQSAFQRIVTAGLKVMYDPQTHPIMVRQMSKPGDPAEVAGEGAASLLAILYKESKGTMPIGPGILAAQIWLCEGLDFMAQAGKIQVSDDVVAMATKSMMAHILQIFHVPPAKINQAMHAGAAQQQGAQPAPASSGIVAGAMSQ